MQKVIVELITKEIKLLRYLVDKKISSLNDYYHKEDYQLKKEYGAIVSKLNKAREV